MTSRWKLVDEKRVESASTPWQSAQNHWASQLPQINKQIAPFLKARVWNIIVIIVVVNHDDCSDENKTDI